jgi:xylan 1,4-beta-xylosidase
MPANCKLWEEMNCQFVKSLVDRYGAAEVRTWMFETGNEPGTEPEFHGRPSRDHIEEDFLKMQDYTVAGVLRALPDAFIGGPSQSVPEFQSTRWRRQSTTRSACCVTISTSNRS